MAPTAATGIDSITGTLEASTPTALGSVAGAIKVGSIATANGLSENALVPKANSLLLGFIGLPWPPALRLVQ
jgi:hypothetical protein